MSLFIYLGCLGKNCWINFPLSVWEYISLPSVSINFIYISSPFSLSLSLSLISLVTIYCSLSLQWIILNSGLAKREDMGGSERGR